MTMVDGDRPGRVSLAMRDAEVLTRQVLDVADELEELCETVRRVARERLAEQHGRRDGRRPQRGVGT